MAKLTKEQIEEIVKAAGYTLVDMSNYINLDSLIEVRCEEKHLNLFSIKQLRRKKQCDTCKDQTSLQQSEKGMISLPPKMDIRLLALDNATKITGFAVYEGGRLIHYGVKEMSKNNDIIARMAEMKQWLTAVIQKWNIDELALEDVYAQSAGYGNAGPQTMIKLAKLLGVLEVAGYELLKGVVGVHSVNAWRSYCKVKTQPRNVAKESAQKFVKDKFEVVVSFDAADAICLGYYAWANRKRNQLEFIKF